MDWQPIETAPRDETPVVLFSEDGIDIGHFEAAWGDGGEWIRRPTAEYDNEYCAISKPTHWMPLPEPPK